MIVIFADSTAQLAVHRVANTWTWYVIRGAGFAAAGLLILLMLSGIGQVTGLTYKFIQPLKAWALHRAMGLALCAAIAVHIIFLLIDHHVTFSLTQILVPFTSHYNNKSALLGLPLASLAVAMGVLAMYGVVIIVLSSLGWINSRKRAWRWLHYLSYLVMLLVFLHALYAGSDLKYGTFRLIWIAMIVLILVGVASRLKRSGSLKQPTE